MGIPQTTGRKAARWDESRHDAVKTESIARLDADRLRGHNQTTAGMPREDCLAAILSWVLVMREAAARK